MLNEFNPQYSSVINFVLQTAGKDKDENYDLKSELLGNLGDDIIHYEKAPQGNTLADLNSAPSLYLIGSPNAGKLAAALKTGLSFMGAAKEREFLGRQIYTLTTAAQGAMPAHSFSFAGSGGYVALSGDTEILEEFLRSNDSKGKTLNDTAGLADAAQKAGGMGTGLFGFDNQNLGHARAAGNAPPATRHFAGHSGVGPRAASQRQYWRPGGQTAGMGRFFPAAVLRRHLAVFLLLGLCRQLFPRGLHHELLRPHPAQIKMTGRIKKEELRSRKRHPGSAAGCYQVS